ncbi:MAG: hypothetical protein R3B96_08790 [Pirellulaceae bacterium]
MAPDADPKNSIYGRDLSSIPNLVLHCQRVIRVILKKYDAAGFQPLDNQLRFRLIAGFDNSAYLWTEREIHIFYQRPRSRCCMRFWLTRCSTPCNMPRATSRASSLVTLVVR